MGFLYMQTKIQQNNIEISSMKKELTALQKETDDLELQVVMSEDIDHVRSVATGEFGMSSAGEGQVVKVALDDDDTQMSAAAMTNGK
jgi:cell division protein FtsL